MKLKKIKFGFTDIAIVVYVESVSSVAVDAAIAAISSRLIEEHYRITKLTPDKLIFDDESDGSRIISRHEAAQRIDGGLIQFKGSEKEMIIGIDYGISIFGYLGFSCLFLFACIFISWAALFGILTVVALFAFNMAVMARRMKELITV